MRRKPVAATSAAILALVASAGLGLLGCQSAAAMSVSPNAVKEAARAASIVQPAMTRVGRAHSDAETARHTHRHTHKHMHMHMHKGTRREH